MDILSEICAEYTWQDKLGNSLLLIEFYFVKRLNILLRYPKALFKLVVSHDVFMVLARCGNGKQSLHVLVL